MSNQHIRSLSIALGASLALILTVSVALGHTGSISHSQNCETGTTVLGHLDSNVAAGATWTLKINGADTASGNGPGPADLGPYVAGFGSGSAVLTITFGQEVNTYSTEWSSAEQCGSEETPAPTVTPTPTATPAPTATPTPTIPDTAMGD